MSRTKSRLIKLFTPAVAALVAISAWAPGAGASPSTKNYEASVSPQTIYIDTPATVVSVALTNDQSSNQSFGSAQVSIGMLSDVTSASSTPQVSYLSNSLGWSETLVQASPAVFQLTSTTGQPVVAPGGSVTIEFSVDAPATGSLPVSTEVKQSNDFLGKNNDFQLQGSVPSITVLAYQLTFAHQPSDVQKSVPSSGNFSYMCPVVTVQVDYPDGSSAPVGGIPITITSAGTSDPGLYFGTAPVPSSGITVETDSSGVATFGTCTSGLAATNLGSGYELQASGASASVSSNPFAVVQSLVDCPAGTCTPPTVTSTVMSGTTGTLSATNDSSGFQLLTSFGQDLYLSCDSAVVGSNPADPLQAVSSVAASGTLTLFFPKAIVNEVPNNGTPLMPICVGAYTAFPGSSKVTPTSTSPYPYQGLLYGCDDPSYLGSPDTLKMCISSESKSAANETVVIEVSSLADDPEFI